MHVFNDTQVQIQLYSQVAAEFCLHKLGSTPLDLRTLIGVPFLMFVLKEHYSVTQKPHNSTIRPYILLIVKQFVSRVRELVVSRLHLTFVHWNIYYYLHIHIYRYSLFLLILVTFDKQM